MRGCRIYGMIYLANDPSVARTETASLCAKSCQANQADDTARTAACASGCRSQDEAFRLHKLDGHSARMAVLFGLARPPVVHSPTAQHWRLFDRSWTPEKQQAASGNAWLHAVRIHIRPLGPGPDGRPRYWVEISERAIPLRLVGLRPRMPDHADSEHQPAIARYWFGDNSEAELPPPPPHTISLLHFRRMSHRSRMALRMAACGFLIASLIGMLWVCCTLARSAKRRKIRVLRGDLIRKLPPSIQSGDIAVELPKKQPLLIDPIGILGTEKVRQDV